MAILRVTNKKFMTQQITQRQFLEKCDLVLTYLNSFGRNSGPSSSQWTEFVESNNLSTQQHEILADLLRKGYIANNKCPMISDQGLEFKRKTTLVKDHDKDEIEKQTIAYPSMNISGNTDNVLIHSPVSESGIETVAAPRVKPKKNINISKTIIILAAVITIITGVIFLIDYISKHYSS
jgi:hypothetical protein